MDAASFTPPVAAEYQIKHVNTLALPKVRREAERRLFRGVRSRAEAGRAAT